MKWPLIFVIPFTLASCSGYVWKSSSIIPKYHVVPLAGYEEGKFRGPTDVQLYSSKSQVPQEYTEIAMVYTRERSYPSELMDDLNALALELEADAMILMDPMTADSSGSSFRLRAVAIRFTSKE